MGHADNEELRDAAIAELARKHSAAIRTNILAAHEQTLHDLGNAVGDRLCDNALMAQLIRTAIACGPLTAGTLFIDLVQRAIDADAEIEALKEVERMECDARTDPDNCRPTRSQMRAMDRAIDMLRI